MTVEALFKTDLWRAFERKARVEKKQPAKLLAEILRHYLETTEHLALIEEISQEARRSGYTEADAVRLVREHRKEKRVRRAAL